MRIVKETPFEVAYVPFKLAPPEAVLCVVVKGTFSLAPTGPARVAPKQRPCLGDAYEDDDPSRGLVYPSDLAVLKPRGECFVLGDCYAPGGAPLGSTAVAFRVGPVTRTLAVFGDRCWNKGVFQNSYSRPAPFTRMPLGWGRAFGGAGFDANPVGLGAHLQAASHALPNVEDPRVLIDGPGSRPPPASPYPVSPSWRARARHLGTYDARWTRQRWPWFPEDFQPDFYNAAPPEQQVAGFFSGDEEIALRNLHPEHALVQSRLPALRAVAGVALRGGSGREDFRVVPLRLDTIIVHADALEACAVWRGIVPVPSDTLEEVTALFAAQEPLAAPPATPEQVYARYRAKRDGEDSERARAALADPPPPARSPELPPDEGPDELAALMERLRADGTLPPEGAAAPASPAAAPDPAGMRAALVEAGAQVPDDFDKLFVLPPDEDPAPEQAPAPPPAPGREELEAHVAAGRSLRGRDLSNARLAGANLAGADLAQAILTGADLTGAKLDGAVMSEAVATRATLVSASLRGVDLTHADLTAADAHGANFDEANLERALFDTADLSQASARKTRGAGANFTRALLVRASFVESELADPVFESARVDHADFTRARMARASFVRASGQRVVFDEAELDEVRAADSALPELLARHVKAPDAGFARSNLAGANFAFARLERADLRRCDLRAAHFGACTLAGARFDEARLDAATLVQADLAQANFERAVARGADLRGCNLHGACLYQTQVDGARFERAILTRTLLEGHEAAR